MIPCHMRRIVTQLQMLPIVLLDQTNSSEDWRGVIHPTNWDAWWASYEQFVVSYAQLAQEAGVEMFSIGSELISTETMRERWLHVIAAVRKVYTGKVLYSANWDHYRQVVFWDALDAVGMTSYPVGFADSNPWMRSRTSCW